MEREERLSKSLHKLLLHNIKVIPVVISLIYVFNTIASFYGYDYPFLSYIVQYLFILSMYLSSFAFGFCRWHRVLIHYIFVILTLNIIDYHWGIPLEDRSLFLLYGGISGVSLFMALYFRFSKC